MAESKLYREEALESISSPDQLTDYLKVNNPRMWVLITAVILLLSGLIVWSMVGSIETVTEEVAVVEGETATISITGKTAKKVKSGMKLRINSEEFVISRVEDSQDDEKLAIAPVTLRDGVYDATIVLESIHPIMFLLK